MDEDQEATLIQLNNNRGINIGDTVIIFLGNCKNAGIFYLQKVVPQTVFESIVPTAIVPADIPFLKVHGNIQYNFGYRSYIDTPFTQHGLTQHNVQTVVKFTIKNKYPVKATISNRSSNSPYFKNLTDVNVEFNRRQLLDNIKVDLLARALSLISTDALIKAESVFNQRVQCETEMRGWLNSPARAQEIVEEKERNYRNSIDVNQLPLDKEHLNHKTLSDDIPGMNTEGFFSTSKYKGFEKLVLKQVTNKVKDTVSKMIAGKDSSYLAKYNAKKDQFTKLQDSVKNEAVELKSKKKNVQDSLNTLKREINSLSTASGLYAFMGKHGISKSELTKAQRILLSINKIGVGRSWVDYSELTVKNISLSGINIEMNPLPFYFAFAAGKVNYRFRDFVLKNRNEVPEQSLYLMRAGIGQKEKNNLIFTFYNGTKTVLNYTAQTPATIQRVLGFSAEGRFALNANNYVIGEVARSSYNSNPSVRESSAALVDKAFNFKTNTNVAYSIKLFSEYPATGTKFTGWYKQIGDRFESFNLNPANVNQDAWMARFNQFIWKKRFNIDAAIRKNDFQSPIAAPSFKTETIFKSLQLTYRAPKYPFVSLGYYPTSQLSLTSNNILVENQYNTLNAIASYSYKAAKLGMNTNAVYTKFYNNTNDSGFIYFNGKSWTLNHSIYLSPFILQSTAGLTEQAQLRVFTLEQMLSYQFQNKLTLSGSLKWNRLNKIENLFGATAGMSMYIKKLGTIQFNYDKSYLPGINRDLIPVNIGRASYYREF